jgi:manganese/zinc/iron transport system permease protein
VWTNRLHTLLALAGILGCATGAVGVRLCGSLPTGPVIVLTGAALFVFSLLAAPERGIVSRLWHEARLRLRVARDHLLRSMYELNVG